MSDGSRRRRIWGWYFFDWASQPYNTLLITFIFGPYVSGLLGDGTAAQAAWGYGLGAAGMVVAVLAPLLGARFHVLGSQSGYTSFGLDGQEAALGDGASPLDEDFGLTPVERWGRFGVGGSAAPLPSLRGDYGAFYRLLADSIHEGAPLPVDPADSVVVLELIERLHLETALHRADERTPSMKGHQ